MARMKDLEGVKTGNLFKAHPSLIIIDPDFNIRSMDDPDTPARIENYAAMLEGGSRPPPLHVWLRGEEIVLIDGYCRLMAARLCIDRGFQIMDLDLIQFVGSNADRVALMLRSGSARSWMPIELVKGYKQLISFGWSIADIAASVGKTPSHVSGILDLGNSDAEIQTMVRAGEVSATTAIKTIRERKDRGDATAVLTTAVADAKALGKNKVKPSQLRQRSAEDVSPDVELAIRADERRAILMLLPSGDMCDPQDIADAIRRRGDCGEDGQ